MSLPGWLFIDAWLARLTHPLDVAVVLSADGGLAASAFGVLHGSGNGIITIARGTEPRAIFGPENYAYRLGILGMPERACAALCLMRRPAASAALHAD